MPRRQFLLEVIPALLLLLFLYAGLSKFLDFKTFRKEMNNQPLPNCWTPFLVWFFPCAEILLSAALIFERTRLFGLYASLVLMGIFTLYSLLILFHVFSYIPCSCGGIIKQLTWPQHLVLNLFFVAASIIGIFTWRRKSLGAEFISKNKK